jgi:hypothetical protein
MLLRIYLSLTLLLLSALVAMLLYRPDALGTRLDERKVLARTLLLSDFCLSTESRHTRHANFPELIAPFQDFPAYYEHFPSSSFFWFLPEKFIQP